MIDIGFLRIANKKIGMFLYIDKYKKYIFFVWNKLFGRPKQ